MVVDPINENEASSTVSGDAESTTGASHSGRSDSTSTTEGRDESAFLGRADEKAIRKAKCMIGLSVLVCALAVLLSVYFLNAQSDQRSFELAVRKDNNKQQT